MATPVKPGCKELEEKPQTFASPATLDHEAYMAGLNSDIQGYTQDRDGGSKTAQLRLDKSSAELRIAQAGLRRFGTLMAGSGRRSIEAPEYMTDEKTGKPKEAPSGKEPAPKEIRWLMDWALIRLVEERSMVNELPDEKISVSGITTGITAGRLANQWTSLNSGACNTRRDEVLVAKYGRRTGWTFGTINHAITAINPAENTEFTGIASAYGYMEQRYGFCWSVMRRGLQHGPIVQPGDSGSVCIHDPSHAWLGLLFGETACGSALMMSMDVVFRDIENVTRCKVTEPKYVVVPRGGN